MRRPEEEPGEPAGGARFIAAMMRQAAPYMSAAYTLTAALLLGLFGGRWLDTRFGTKPWCLTAGLLLGLVVGMYELARVALKPRDGGGE